MERITLDAQTQYAALLQSLITAAVLGDSALRGPGSSVTLGPLPVLTHLNNGEERALTPIPSLNRKHPSTSFKVRGTELRLDVLTPLVGKSKNAPLILWGLGVVAHPLRFLDFLVKDPPPHTQRWSVGVVSW